MIHVRDFSFAYPAARRAALAEVSFDVERGEVLGVVGPVGSGRTTLCFALAGFAPRMTGGQAGGVIEVAGMDTRKTASEEMARRVALVLEDPNAQRTQLHAVEEVMSPLLNRGVHPDQAEPWAQELMEQVQLDASVRHRRTWELSSGEQMRLAIAAALGMQTEVLVLDSTTAALDSRGSDMLVELVQGRKGRLTTVIVENDLEVLMPVADKLLVLVDGSVSSFGPTRDVIRDDRAVHAADLDQPLSLRVARQIGVAGDPLQVDDLLTSLREQRREEAPPGPYPSRTPLRHGAEVRSSASRPEGTAGSRARPEPLLRLSDVSYRWEAGARALRSVSLEVDPGRIHAVVGPTGAGKSTLIHLIAGFARPDEGRLEVGGRQAHTVPAAERARTVATTFSNPDEFLTERTVRDELSFPITQRRRRGAQRSDDVDPEHRVRQLCELVGIPDERLEEDPRLLSFGDRKLVALAESLALAPPVVALDQPGGGLGPATKRLRRVLTHLRDDGRAVLFTEHDIELVAGLADDVTVLVDGEVRLQGTVADVLGPERWDELAGYGIRPPRSAVLARALGVAALDTDRLLGTVRPIHPHRS